VLINALSFLTVFLLTRVIGWGTISGLFFSYIIGVGLPHFVVGSMGNRRLKRFNAAFPEAIDTMCRGLRSGLPVTESIAAVGREMPEPVGTEFHRIADGVRMGKSVESSMWEVAKRVDTPEYRFLIIAMAIQKETGGNLAETLGNLSDLIRRRRQLRMKVKAMSSEARASAMIIGSLPFIMLILLSVVNPAYTAVLFTTFKGKVMLGVGGSWMLIGWGIMTKMINFEL
jgi:tight adherence protein B